MSSNRRQHDNIQDEREKKKVEIGHCHLMWLGFYFSLHVLWEEYGCFKQKDME